VQSVNKVELKNVKNGMKMTYTIVSESEANLKEGKISVNTPIAHGLLGKKSKKTIVFRYLVARNFACDDSTEYCCHNL